MRVWGMVLGGYPRSREARHLLRDVERGLVPPAEATLRLQRVHSEIIGVQKAAGLPVIVDGMVDWHDIFRPFARSWRNVTVNGLLRYFDNNFFYRIPVFVGEPDSIEPVLAPRVRDFVELAHPGILKVVVPGPVTFARLSKNNSELSYEELAVKIASILKQEISRAVEAGAGFIQVDEPFLADVDASKDDAALAVELFNKIIKGYEEKASLAVYFNAPTTDIYEIILNVKSRYLSIDVYDTRIKALDLLATKGFGDHVPVLGVIDGRRIHDDNIDKIVDDVRRLIDRSIEELVFTTTTWMDLIPFRYSLRKTILLSRLVEKFAEETDSEAYTIWR